jgi:hypothetical protein
VSGVSLRRPDNAKPKGRTISDTKKRVIKLGAKGDKKKTKSAKGVALLMVTTVALVYLWRRIGFGWPALLVGKEGGP